MSTKRGVQCEYCKEAGALTEFIALVPMVDKTEVILPHAYSVCSKCYAKQWADKYSEATGFASYADYLASKNTDAPS